MDKRFELIVIVQSYPNLIHALNYVLEKSEQKTLFLVNGDKKIEKFVLDVFKGKRSVTVKRFGHAIFLRSRLFSWALPLYVYYLYFRMPRFFAKEKLITYGNWCDVGGIFHEKTQGNKVVNLIGYEEERYTIQSAGFKDLPLFLKIQNKLCEVPIERKLYIYEEDGVQKNTGNGGFGILRYDDSVVNIQASRERRYDLLAPYIKMTPQRFILLVEKNLIKSGAISVPSFLRLLFALRDLSSRNKLPIFVKFKPRDRFFFRKYLYRLFGFLILPTEVPAQLFAQQKSCACLIGFSSSSMAEDYGKATYSFGSIKEFFKPEVYGNINSLRQRSKGNDNCVFLETEDELRNLIV